MHNTQKHLKKTLNKIVNKQKSWFTVGCIFSDKNLNLLYITGR